MSGRELAQTHLKAVGLAAAALTILEEEMVRKPPQITVMPDPGPFQTDPPRPEDPTLCLLPAGSLPGAAEDLRALMPGDRPATVSVVDTVTSEMPTYDLPPAVISMPVRPLETYPPAYRNSVPCNRHERRAAAHRQKKANHKGAKR